jgi:lysine biosynthesis protein LysW
MTTLICPYCESEIKPHHESHLVGDFIDCPICAAELEIVSMDPLVVEYIESEK